jgi:hypothetical protein
MATTRAYEELVDFIADGIDHERIIAFQPSEGVKARLSDLIEREKTSSLSREETSELDHYLQLEHLMRLVKARARQHVSNA